MFSFVIKYFGFLKHVPLLPHVFESFMKVVLLFTNAHVLDCMDDIASEVLSWRGTSIGIHKYGGLQFNYDGKELGHIHGNGLLDMLFSRKIKQELLAEGRITHHHFFTNSGWISFYIRNEEDMEYAKGLLKMGYEKAQNRPKPLAKTKGSERKEIYFFA